MEYMFMPLKRYADFSGRSRRMEYWMFVLLQMLLYFAMIMLLLIVAGGAIMAGGNDPAALAAAGGGALIVMMLYVLVSLGLFIPALAVSVRRLHDTNRTGWWIVAPMAPYLLLILVGVMVAASPDMAIVAGVIALIAMLAVFVLAITVFIFMVLDGTRGPNRFGPDPKGPEHEKVFA